MMNEIDNDTLTFVESLDILFKDQKEKSVSIKNTSSNERIQKLKNFRTVVVNNKDNIVDAIYNDFQRPKAASYIVEVGALLNQIDYAVTHLEEWMKPEPLNPVGSNKENPYTAEILYEAKGTVLIIGPWNVPFYLTLYPLVSAIAGGNTAIIKPSELTLHTSAIIKSVIEEAFDKEEVALVEGGIPETTELLKKPFDHIYFTGSPKVAKIVMRAAAENLSSVTLELGGKAPAVIDESANLDNAAYRIMKAKSLNAGQICMDVDYVLVPEGVKAEFIKKAKHFLTEAYGEDFEYQDYDQIINQANFDRLKRLYDNAIQNGAKLQAGGIFNQGLRKIQPTILSEVSLDSEIMHEEIFGPLLPIITYNSKEEAVQIINNIQKPLGSYIFCENNDFSDYILQHTTAGGTVINDVMIQAFDPALPFGGVNNSGIGKGYGKYGFQELTNARTVVRASSSSSQDTFLKAPYDGKIEMIKDAIV